MYLLFALLNYLAMEEIPPLIPFLINKYISLSEIGSIYISVILSIAS